MKGRTIVNRVENALPVLIIYRSILRRMFIIRRHAEMRDGGGESSTIDNNIRQILTCVMTEFQQPVNKLRMNKNWLPIGYSPDKQNKRQAHTSNQRTKTN